MTKAAAHKLARLLRAQGYRGQLSVKLSTALVGFGVAILIGLKSGIRLSPFVRFFLLAATILFAQSALYAILWRMGVAELWLNECLSLISQPKLTVRYDAHLYFFIAGLLALSFIVVGAALGKLQATKEEP